MITTDIDLAHYESMRLIEGPTVAHIGRYRRRGAPTAGVRVGDPVPQPGWFTECWKRLDAPEEAGKLSSPKPLCKRCISWTARTGDWLQQTRDEATAIVTRLDALIDLHEKLLGGTD